MPYINIRLGIEIDVQVRERLFTETTELMACILGKNPAVTVVHIEESQRAQWAIGGRSLTSGDAPGAYVDIKITQATNTPAEKSEMIARMIALLRNALGDLHVASYVVIDEVPADSWGYDGMTQAARAAAAASDS